MSDADDSDMLQVNNRRLERENRALRASLWDGYFSAAMGAFGGRLGRSDKKWANEAAALADAMLVERNIRYGRLEKKAKNEGGAA